MAIYFSQIVAASLPDDSDWQGKYGGKFDAIMPNEKFPDMKGMCERLHAMGFKCGIYSTPMLNAFGCSINHVPLPPGCTQGEPDDRFADERGGIGVIRSLEIKVLQQLPLQWRFHRQLENLDGDISNVQRGNSCDKSGQRIFYGKAVYDH